MPFTFSHPAIILPLNYLPKKWISLTGLIIGSLTPDFEYFIRMKIESNYSHTFWGIFWFDLPLGILMTFVFHNIVKHDLIKNLPKKLNERFRAKAEENWNKYFARNWKIVIGILSHIFWDSFTHQSGIFVKVFSKLLKPIEILGKPIKIFKILQHLSTIIGGFVIAFTIYKLPVNVNIENMINTKYWIILISITILVFVLRLIIGENTTKIGTIIVSLISAGILGLIFTPIILKIKNES